MAKSRTSMQKSDQINLMIERGYSKRAIQRALCVSLPTINKLLGLSKPPEPGLSENETGLWAVSLDWVKIKDEVHRRGTTIKQLHREYAPEINYLSFWRAVRLRCPVEAEISMRLVFKPGERTQIDFTDGLQIVDPSTGAIRKTQLFVGVLAFSSRVYAEFVWDQRLPTFISAHDRMWHYFGGVTPYVIVDNLKSGVTHADLYDPDVNPTYTDYANHMGFAVLPARPYHPRDKAKGESNINVIQRQFYQEVRDRIFYGLDDLNRVLWKYLAALDVDIMKDNGVSRMDRFTEEAVHLQALPPTRFEISDWRSAKVHPDCHVQVQKNFYSVPYKMVGQNVRVRVTERLVEMFSEDGDALASHAKLLGTGKTSTQVAHYPEQKAAVASFSISHAKAEAKLIGPKMTELIEEMFSGSHPLTKLRPVQGILRLAKVGNIDRSSLEYAAEQAMNFNKMRVAYIKTCALFHQKNGARPVSATSPTRDLKHIHLHNEGKT